MYAGNEQSLQLLKQYKVDYAYIGPTERQFYHANENFFMDRFPLVFTKNDVKVYKIR